MPAFDAATREVIFGKFTWTESQTRRGMIVPDGQWVTANITQIGLPYFSNDEPRIWRGKCHCKVALSLEKAFDDLEVAGLLHLIRTIDGCYVPRHTLWNPKNGLSTHSWGIAIDLNAKLIPYGSTKQQDPRVVRIFANHGFLFGHKGSGLWKNTKDGMHAEYVYDPRK